jgi:hypothetical protein
MSAARTGVSAVAVSNAAVTAPTKSFVIMAGPSGLPAFFLPAWLYLVTI